MKRGPMSGACPDHKRLRCVIVESGSLSLAEAGAGDFEETIVIAQTPGEAAAAFAERVTSRLASVERLRKRLQSAVVLVGTRHDAAANVARRTVLSSLSRHLGVRGAGTEINLMTRPEAGSEQRAGLLALADALLALPSSERVPIRLQFGQPRAA